MGGSLAEQQALRDELRAHIRDAVREQEIGGVGHGEAVRVALRDLGEPERLGRSMRGVRGAAPLKRPLIQPEGALILERRGSVRLPSGALSLAVAALGVALVALGVTYLWPS
jgi:hypothetical protein